MSKFQQVCSTLSENPKTWCVTGVAGFIGSNLLESLLKIDQTVVGLDNFATGHRSNLNDVQKSVTPEQWDRFRFVEGDIQDPETCASCLKGVQNVLHQAALGSVPRSIVDPATSTLVNVNGTLNMFYAAKEAGIENFVYASSSSVYGDHPDLPKVEDQIGKPLSPYAITKLSNELYAQNFSEVYGFKASGMRYFNVFGKRQDPNGAYAAVIPKWVAAILKGDEVQINGDGLTSRDFCYIANVVQANILAAESEDDGKGQPYNIAVGDNTSLNELFDLLVELLQGMGVEYALPAKHVDFRPGDVRHSLADISKAKDLLGYLPTHSLREGLIEALSWYCENV